MRLVLKRGKKNPKPTSEVVFDEGADGYHHLPASARYIRFSADPLSSCRRFLLKASLVLLLLQLGKPWVE